MIVIDSSTDATDNAAFGDDTQVIVVNDATTATTEFVEEMSKTFGLTSIQAAESFREIARASAGLVRLAACAIHGYLSDSDPDQCKTDQAPTRDRRGHASDRRRRWSRRTYGLG